MRLKRRRYIQLHIRIPREWVGFLVSDMETCQAVSVSDYFRALLRARRDYQGPQRPPAV